MLKNLTTTLVLLTAIVTVSIGQIRTPAASPAAKFTQTVGLTEVSGEYSRPAKRGRAIFGDLVPYDKIWRTGANQATKISFSKDVTVEGQALKAGDYAILTKPGMTQWEVQFHSYETGNWGSYVEKDPAATITSTVVSLPFSVENFGIGFDNVKAESAVMHFIWDNVLVPVQVGVSTDAGVMASIEKTLAGPTAGDYYAAGAYMHDSGKDLGKALMYVQKATSGDSPRFWQVRKESLILADLGRKAEAISAAKKSLKLATEAGNDDYVKMNKDSIKKWSM